MLRSSIKGNFASIIWLDLGGIILSEISETYKE